MKRNAHRYFSSARVMADIAAISAHTRWQTTPEILNAASHMIRSLEGTPGLADLELVELPSDGRTFHGGWVMPKCWDVKSATLKIVSPDSFVLANYRENPWSLMMWSPATPAGGIEAGIVHVAEALKGRPQLKGKFALVDTLGQCSVDVVAWLAELGAVGLISDYVIPCKGRKEGKYLDGAIQYRNYTNPQWDGAPRLPAFGLTPDTGKLLRKWMARNSALRLHASVDARLYDGFVPLVNARLKGESDDEIVLTAHMDEPGASDNASGSAVAMEVLRALAQFAKKRGRPLRRSIRLLSSIEARGIQALIATQPFVNKIKAGLNLDMIGYDQRVGRAPLDIISALPSVPSCLENLLAGLAAEEAARGPGFRWKASRGVIVNDCHFAMPPFNAPMCCIEQAPDKTYHTSLDQTEMLSPKHIARMGSLICKAVLFLADAQPSEVISLAENVYGDALRELQRKDTAPQAALKNVRKVWSELKTYLPDGVPAPDEETVVRMRREKIMSRGGLYPKAVLQEKMAGWSAQLEVLAASHRNQAAVIKPSASSQENKAARAIVPQKTFAGYLAFEDLSKQQRAALKSNAGITPGWGAPDWLQWALDLSNGKRTLLEIFEIIRRERPIKLESLLRAFPALCKSGRVRFRAIIKSGGLREALRRAGVRPGDILMTHSSLSDFGYFDGGADSVIDTLLKAVGRSGTIIVPTHSLNWVGELPYDPKTSPSLVGAITTQFLRRKEARRSLHPTHSVAAIGPMAEKLIAGHDQTVAPQSRDGFWGNLVKYNGKVLLLCKQSSNTLLHAGELWAGAPLPDCKVHILKDGRRVESTMPGVPWHVDHFNQVHERMAKRGLMKSTPLGESFIHLLRAKDGIETMAELMREDPLAPVKTGCDCRWCLHVRAHTKKK